MDWQLELRRYAKAPLEAWPRESPLQAHKLVEAINRHCQGRGLGQHELLASVIATATGRTQSRPPTLFLINCGSSGSHWVEAMLSALPGIHACGEVYVPPGLGTSLAAADEQARACWLDALHQLHVERSVPVAVGDVLINSAHSWNPHDLMGASALPVLLVRDPLEVVISRTFRKPRLRRHLTPDASDREYLDRNVAMVEKFYRSALRRRPVQVRYEEFVTDPASALARLLGLLGRSEDPALLEGIARQYSADSQARAGKRLSNVYQGARMPAEPDLLATAAEQLSKLRADMGYS